MLTPQEVSERAFQRASFGSGYNMAQVDEFLDVLTADYSSLYNDNAVLKNKLKVLVDKVEEYRATEDSMRKALMTAQRMADELIKEAEEQKESIIRSAEQEAQSRRDEILQGIDDERYRLQAAQQATAAFVEQVYALQSEQARLLANLQELCPGDGVPIPAPTGASDRVGQTASEIGDNVQRLLAKAMKDNPEPASAPRAESRAPLQDTGEYTPVRRQDDAPPEDGDAGVEDDPARPRRRIDFGKLQFGRDYDIN